jgi:hypothetical protein
MSLALEPGWRGVIAQEPDMPDEPPAVEIPPRVARRLDPTERPLATMLGAQGAGIVITDQRVVRWRPPGGIVSIPLDAIDSVELRTTSPEGEALFAIACRGSQGAIVLALSARHAATVPAAVNALVPAVLLVHRARRESVELARVRTATMNRWSFVAAPERRFGNRVALPPSRR